MKHFIEFSKKRVGLCSVLLLPLLFLIVNKDVMLAGFLLMLWICMFTSIYFIENRGRITFSVINGVLFVVNIASLIIAIALVVQQFFH